MKYKIYEAKTGFYVGSRMMSTREKWRLEDAGFICKETGKVGEKK